MRDDIEAWINTLDVTELLRSSHPDTSVGVVHDNTVASNNISLPTSKSDLSGHTLVGTYLDAARAAREKVNSMVQTVLDRL